MKGWKCKKESDNKRNSNTIKNKIREMKDQDKDKIYYTNFSFPLFLYTNFYYQIKIKNDK